jgi:RNA polymerase sigma-70 factor (ECF subfamily)
MLHHANSARLSVTVLAYRMPGRRPAWPLEDAQVISRAADGDLAAFEGLYRAHAGWVYGLCLRLTGQRQLAEDCTQESFVAAWRGLASFRKQSQFSTWLHRIAVNTVLNRRRAERRSALVSAEEHAESVAAVPGASDAAGPIDVERAIARLPRGARDVLVLVGIYGYTHEEAAAMLRIATGTSKAQLHRARALLTAHLDLEILEQA